MFCLKCGSEINESQKFCPNCGNQINIIKDVKSSSAGYNKSKESKIKYVLSLLAGILLTIISAAYILYGILFVISNHIGSDYISVIVQGCPMLMIEFSFVLLGVRFILKSVFMHLRDTRKQKALVFVPNLICSLALIADAICVIYLYFSGYDSKQYVIFYILVFLAFAISGAISLMATVKNRNKAVEFPDIYEKTDNCVVSQNSVNANSVSMQDVQIDEKPKQKPINIIANILWFIFGGFASGMGWLIVGVLWCITIIGIPLGKQCFKFAKLTALPFGRDIIYTQSTAKTIVNIIWLLFTGLSSAVTYALAGAAFCITIIGIPFGLQYFKFAKLMLMPFGAKIVYKK